MPLFSERDAEGEPAGEVAEVFPCGPADLAGVLPGDRIVLVNGHPLEDVIDVQFHAASQPCVLTVHPGGRALDIRRLNVIHRKFALGGLAQRLAQLK